MLPEIIAPGTGLSGTTDKSVMPFNNVHTIWDVLTGDQYTLPGAGGSWGDWDHPDGSEQGSYKPSGDLYKRRERDLDIMRNLMNIPNKDREIWKVKVKGGYKEFPSLEAAQEYRRKMEEKGIFIPWVSKVAQSKQDWVDVSLEKTFMIESLNFSENTKETGSAFSIGNGYLLTCAHVIKKYNKNTESTLDFSKYEAMIRVIVVADGKRVEAKVISFDGTRDIALLKADINVRAFTFDTTISIGEEVFAIGSPHGFENNASFGHVSSTDKQIYFHKDAPLYMFVDLSIFPGNSGGPIINKNTGKVIGMVTAIVGENDNYGLNAGLLSSYLVDFCEENNMSIKL